MWFSWWRHQLAYSNPKSKTWIYLKHNSSAYSNLSELKTERIKQQKGSIKASWGSWLTQPCRYHHCAGLVSSTGTSGRPLHTGKSSNLTHPEQSWQHFQRSAQRLKGKSSESTFNTEAFTPVMPHIYSSKTKEAFSPTLVCFINKSDIEIK